MKTQYIIQDSAWIDPISYRIKGLSFCEFKDDHWHSRINFSLFSQWNLTFEHSLDREIDLEVKGSNRFKDGGV